MPKPKKIFLDLTKSEKLLICTLYTICESQKIFKKLNLKNDIYLDLSSRDGFFNNLENFREVYVLLNKTSLRKFSYILISPLLKLKYAPLPKKNITKFEEIYYDRTLLKSYLTRFRYNYHRYFICQSTTWQYLPTDKEINICAITILFLIIGI